MRTDPGRRDGGLGSKVPGETRVCPLLARPESRRPRPRGRQAHILTVARGLLLAWSVTGANRTMSPNCCHCSTRSRPCRARPGGHASGATRVIADRGYDHDKYRRLLRARGFRHSIARRQTEHGSGLGRDRWVVERTISHLHNKASTTRLHRPHQDHPRRAAQPRSLPALLQPTPPLILLELLRAGLRP